MDIQSVCFSSVRGLSVIRKIAAGSTHSSMIIISASRFYVITGKSLI